MAVKIGLGAAVVALFIAVLFYVKRGDHLEPTGSILKVRSIAADEQRSIVVLDLRIQNDSDIALVVRDLTLTAETADGQEVKGAVISAVDTKQVFQYYPSLGEIYNEPILQGSRIAPRQAADFMLAGRLDMSEQQFAARRKLSVTVQDRSILTFTLLEKHK